MSTREQSRAVESPLRSSTRHAAFQQARGKPRSWALGSTRFTLLRTAIHVTPSRPRPPQITRDFTAVTEPLRNSDGRYIIWKEILALSSKPDTGLLRWTRRRAVWPGSVAVERLVTAARTAKMGARRPGGGGLGSLPRQTTSHRTRGAGRTTCTAAKMAFFRPTEVKPQALSQTEVRA